MLQSIHEIKTRILENHHHDNDELKRVMNSDEKKTEEQEKMEKLMGNDSTTIARSSSMGSFCPELLRKWKKYESLTEFNLRGQRLNFLPKEMIISFKNLCVLNLSYNNFEVWPEVICRLGFLEYLYLNGNKLSRVSDNIGELSHLKSLFLSENRLVELPETIGNLTSLERLILGSIYGGNQLTYLPDSMGHLKSLVELDVSYNRLKELPTNLGGLQSLEILSCFQNQLERLPPSMAECRRLKSLDLGRNCLKEIPSVLGNHLKELEYISLIDNQLEHLPSEIIDRRDLTLLISGNPFLGATSSIMTSGSFGDKDMMMVVSKVPSLLELSARTIIQTGNQLSTREPLPHLLELFLKCAKSCSRCQGPMFRECLRNISVSEYLGHPSVPQKSDLCSSKCLLKCRQKFIRKIDW